MPAVFRHDFITHTLVLTVIDLGIKLFEMFI